MGGSTSSLQISHKIWPLGTTHETYTKVFNREAALSSYLPGEKVSFGKIDRGILEYLFNDTFTIIDKGQNYLDGYRKRYTDMEECCTTNITYKKEFNAILSCSNDTKTFNNDLCDDIMFETCGYGTNEKCAAWIRAQVQRKGRRFNELLDIYYKEAMRTDEYGIVFLEALRDFATESNNYNAIADQILDTYSEFVKEQEYKCAFPNTDVIEKEKSIQTPKECWYRECSISPLYKLKTENIKKRDLCTITICDIDIKNLNMSTQDLQIICKNKFNNQQIDINKTPIKLDSENFFFIPEFKNTVLPAYILFALCFLFNK